MLIVIIVIVVLFSLLLFVCLFVALNIVVLISPEDLLFQENGQFQVMFSSVVGHSIHIMFVMMMMIFEALILIG